MSRKARTKKLTTKQLEKSLLARDHILTPMQRQQRETLGRLVKEGIREQAAGKMPEVVYIRRLAAREERHTADPEALAAEAEYRCEPDR